MCTAPTLQDDVDTANDVKKVTALEVTFTSSHRQMHSSAAARVEWKVEQVVCNTALTDPGISDTAMAILRVAMR